MGHGRARGPSPGGGPEEVDGLPECRELDSGGRGDGLGSRDRKRRQYGAPRRRGTARGTQNSP